MIDKNSEMSLDEVLSSIKKMVVDEEPPVLDLTDMVRPDGSIVKVKNSENTDMGAFLKLVQENTDSISAADQKRFKGEYVEQQLKKAPVISADVSSSPFFSELAKSEKKTDKNEAILELVKEIAEPSVNKWIENHLYDMAKQAIDEKIKAIEGKICDLFEKH
jgi:cell pole-organizing protein PopZ